MRRAAAGLCAAAWLAGCAGTGEPVQDGRYAMGTVLEITLPDTPPRRAQAALAELFAIAERLDQLMTIHDPESQLSRLNRAAGQGPMTVDPDVAGLLQRSLDFAALTEGSFDVTVGPLVELWIEAAVRGALPDDDELARARSRVGAGAIAIHGPDRVELRRAGVRVDLGGVAKGFALDRMRDALRARRIPDALVSFGQSSTLALGAPPDAPGWRLLVRGPDGAGLGVITLRDQSLSVSSSFGHWLEIEGRRYGHVIDPRSGMPLTRALQAHVVAQDASLAEALTKALLILPPDRGIALVAEQPGCEGLLLDDRGHLRRTPGWDAVTGFEPLPPGLAQGPHPRGRWGRHAHRGAQLPRL